MEDTERIRHLAADLRLDAVGFTTLPLSEELGKKLKEAGTIPFVPSDIQVRSDAEALLPKAKSAIVILFPYKPQKREKGNIALYAQGKDYHRLIHAYLARLIETLQENYPKESFFPLVDTSPLVDRWLAYAAGLGFFGKNHCLIHKKYGSYFTIGSLLTTMALPGATPTKKQCGVCTRCIKACPGRALSETNMNSWQCKSWITQKKEELTNEERAILVKTPLIFGCDECQNICPFNAHAAPSPLPEFEKDRISTLTTETLINLSNRAFQRNYKEYAFSWRGKPILLRNAKLIDEHKK